MTNALDESGSDFISSDGVSVSKYRHNSTHVSVRRCFFRENSDDCELRDAKRSFPLGLVDLIPQL